MQQRRDTDILADQNAMDRAKEADRARWRRENPTWAQALDEYYSEKAALEDLNLDILDVYQRKTANTTKEPTRHINFSMIDADDVLNDDNAVNNEYNLKNHFLPLMKSAKEFLEAACPVTVTDIEHRRERLAGISFDETIYKKERAPFNLHNYETKKAEFNRLANIAHAHFLATKCDKLAGIVLMFVGAIFGLATFGCYTGLAKNGYRLFTGHGISQRVKDLQQSLEKFDNDYRPEEKSATTRKAGV